MDDADHLAPVGELVSIVVPTKNSGRFLADCLQSLRKQSYDNIELIVVDNHSIDATWQIAEQLADAVYCCGNERSAQVNFGVQRARGKYIYKVDSDFVVHPDVVQQCITAAAKGYDAVVVHNSPDTSVSWIAKIRKFEVDMYKYDLNNSSARFVRRDAYFKIGGFNESITAGEDYDFQSRLNGAGFRTGFIDAEALHLGEPISLITHLTKYYQYGKEFGRRSALTCTDTRHQLSFVRRVYIKNWRRFAQNPLIGGGFLIYHPLKYIVGSAGYIEGALRSRFKW